MPHFNLNVLKNIGLAIFALNFACWKVVKGTQWIHPSCVDLHSGQRGVLPSRECQGHAVEEIILGASGGETEAQAVGPKYTLKVSRTGWLLH
jgi:hypothetical protein